MPDHDETTPINPGPLILVAADDQTHRAIVTRMVRTLGFPVHNCAGSFAALQFLREQRGEVRLLLADLAMRRMDGGELAERGKDLDPRLGVVLMAAPTDPHVAELLGGYYDLPFLNKPVSFADLAAMLRHLLGPAPRAPTDPQIMTRPRRRRGSGQHSG
jgi:two-component system cell cycle sensor histidine kinase/response regulator CckA